MFEIDGKHYVVRPGFYGSPQTAIGIMSRCFWAQGDHDDRDDFWGQQLPGKPITRAARELVRWSRQP